jgi:hypothetical protein
LGLVAISSCSTTKRIIPLVYNHSDKLRLDGFYYSSLRIGDDELVRPIYLYRNGIVFSCGWIQFSSEDMKNKILDSFATMQQPPSTFAYKMRGFWGSYDINSDTIRFKKLQSEPGGIIIESKGLITSPESIDIIEASGKKVKKVNNETPYKFRQSLTKPDSTNNFFK